MDYLRTEGTDVSGLFAVLLSSQDTSLVVQLDQLVSRSKRRGGDGTHYSFMRNGKFSEPITGDKLYHRDLGGGKFGDYDGIIGCSYSSPVSLSIPDPGPFFVRPDGNVAIAYDGVVSGHDGMSLVKWLETDDPELHWTDLVAQLDGQFALIMISRRRPEHIYYAVKAKPLYVLLDSINRGVIITSSIDSVKGMYHEGRTSSPVELKPYTAGDVSLEGVVTEKKSLVRFPGEGSLVLCGGGLDSLVASYDAKKRYPTERMKLVYFNYGAKSVNQEKVAQTSIAASLNIRYPDSATTPRTYNFPLLRTLAASSLTDPDLTVSITPEAGRASEWLPARNTVLMSLALALAESQGYARIVTGINQDAATAYADNDEEWMRRFQQLIPFAVGSGRSVRLDSPLSMMSKVDIVRHGDSLKIPWSTVSSWSCYNGGQYHCGLCSSCRARRKAFKLAKVEDPTRYAQ